MLLGDRFQKRAHEWQRKFSCIGDVRGLGAMQAFEIVKPDGSRTPDAETTKKMTRYCYEHGVILVTAGTYSNIIRLLMPLVITNEQLEEGLDVIESALLFAQQPESAPSEIPVAVS
jgi:4-aminobutyrate aminotransferase/(S)-3-amino-2-methylpropionate transaminase